MNTKTFSEIINLIKVGYNKTYDKEELETMYELFKDYDSEILKQAVKNLIGSKYIPSVSQIINQYTLIKRDQDYERIVKAKEMGVIQTKEEFDKCIKWLDKGIVPNWLGANIKEDKISQEEALEFLDGWDF